MESLNNRQRQIARSVNSLLQESDNKNNLLNTNNNFENKLTSLKVQYGITNDKNIYDSNLNIGSMRLAQSIRDLQKNR